MPDLYGLGCAGAMQYKCITRRAPACHGDRGRLLHRLFICSVVPPNPSDLSFFRPAPAAFCFDGGFYERDKRMPGGLRFLEKPEPLCAVS